MQERSIEVARTARYYMLGTPSPNTTEIWIVCHGFAQLASRFLNRFAELEVPGRVLVAPEALNRFYLDTSPRPHGADAQVGATWMTREDREHEIRDYVRYLDAVVREVRSLCGSANPALLALGFSQGVATACRWFSRGGSRINDLVLCGGTLPADPDLFTDPDRWRAAVLTFVWGNRDKSRHATAIAADQTRLAQTGLAAQWLEFEGGHEIHIASIAKLRRVPPPDR